MADRIDHFSGMRAEPEPQAQPEEGSPVVNHALVEHLLLKFPRKPPQGAADLDAMVMLNSRGAYEAGVQAVIDHLATLIPGA